MGLIVPVILSGGSGSRLWPQSREHYPKQFLPLTGERTLIQESALRMAYPALFSAPVIVCNETQRFIVAEQMRSADIVPRAILVEPCARNTAAAIAAAAVTLDHPGTLMLVAPADHLITDTAAFIDVVRRGVPSAEAGKLVTFGMTPTSPETGYGYIKRGPLADEMRHDGVFAVERFVEKPDRATAEAYLASGEYSWNSGIFLFTAGALLDELQAHAPAVLEAVRRSATASKRDLDFIRLDAEAFAAAPSISIDYAVMERTDKAVVVPAAMGWTDIGSWSALWDVAAHDETGNAWLGDAMLQDSTDCYVDSAGHLTALVGMNNVVVVSTPDATLVADKSRSQDVRRIVDRLKQEHRREAISHRRDYRPWGHYEILQEAPRYEVRHVRLLPSASLTMQKHERRAEHWVIVSGLARITCDGRTVELGANQSTYISPGSFHRLENALADRCLDLIEVRTGIYLGEDDIVRIEQ